MASEYGSSPVAHPADQIRIGRSRGARWSSTSRTASSCSGEALPTVAVVSSVKGFSTSRGAPSPATLSPPINRLVIVSLLIPAAYVLMALHWSTLHLKSGHNKLIGVLFANYLQQASVFINPDCEFPCVFTKNWEIGIVVLAVIWFSALMSYLKMRVTQNYVNVLFWFYAAVIFLLRFAGVWWLIQGNGSSTDFGSNWNPLQGETLALGLPANLTFFSFAILALLGIETPLNMGAEVTGGDPVDVMKGLDADSPSKPFGGREEFTFTPDGAALVFAARDAGREEAWSTNLDVFVSPIDGRSAPRNLTASNQATDTAPASFDAAASAKHR